MILELHRLLDSEDSSIKAISNWISVDSALSAKVLKMANSPYFGGKGQVNSIPQAITLLGLEAVKSIVLGDVRSWVMRHRWHGFHNARDPQVQGKDVAPDERK